MSSRHSTERHLRISLWFVLLVRIIEVRQYYEEIWRLEFPVAVCSTASRKCMQCEEAWARSWNAGVFLPRRHVAWSFPEKVSNIFKPITHERHRNWQKKTNFHSSIFTFHSLVDTSLCLFLLVEFTRTFPNILIGRSMNSPSPCLQATRGTVNCLSYLISDAIIYNHVTAWLADMLFYETLGLLSTDLFDTYNVSNNGENLGMEISYSLGYEGNPWRIFPPQAYIPYR